MQKARKNDQRPRGLPEERDYDQRIVDLARVTRVTAGGKRMRFRACVVIGNKKGEVGYGVAKGLDVAGAVSKATRQARKNLITIPFFNETIAYPANAKFKAAKLFVKPAPKGTGIKAGGAARIVYELAGIPNIIGKCLGSGNKINNVRAAFVALEQLIR